MLQVFRLSCCFVLVLTLFGATTAVAQRERPLDPISQQLKPTRMVTYKTVGDRELKLHIFNPDDHQSSDRRSVYFIVHGGGWTGGYPWRCYPFADYFRDRGLVAITIDYRLLSNPPGTTVFDCVKDGR